MKIPIRIPSGSTRSIKLFPRLSKARRFGWISLIGSYGNARLTINDGGTRPFPFSGQPVSDGLVSLALFSHSDPEKPVSLEIEANADGFQGVLYLEAIEDGAASLHAVDAGSATANAETHSRGPKP